MGSPVASKDPPRDRNLSLRRSESPMKDEVALNPEALRQELLGQSFRGDIAMFSTRPERISIILDRPDSFRGDLLGCTWHCDHETIRIQSVDKEGFLAPMKTIAFSEAQHATLLQPGDVLESINEFLCRGRALDEAFTFLENLVGTTTLVFSTTNTPTTCLCQTIVVSPPEDHGIACSRDKNGRLQIAKLVSQYDELSLGDHVLAIGPFPSLSLDPSDAELLLSTQAVTSLALVLTTLPCTKAQRRWKTIKRVSVAVGGGTLVGVGAVIMVTPLHPVGHAMALGGVGVLGTEFEGPRRALQFVRNKITGNKNRENRTGLNPDELTDDESTSESKEEIHQHVEK